MKNQVQLIAYVDRFSGGGLRDLQTMLEGLFRGLFGGVHLLPFFYPIDGVDAGFDPIDHTHVDPRLGTWDDVRAVAEHADIMADLIVNHVSRQSPQFADFQQHGDGSAYAGMFLTYDRVFPGGAREADLLKIYRPRPALPFTRLR
ncbi:MAG TPA: alpha-amylase family glycosyl hydrolase, partial [Bryobacteraceae bacterium]|nr:alpha-amylase family glycosyl hydrolase [Bryobacteraceae bacterium]